MPWRTTRRHFLRGPFAVYQTTAERLVSALAASHPRVQAPGSGRDALRCVTLTATVARECPVHPGRQETGSPASVAIAVLC